ncbi:carbon-nitrogen hydrolase family protein [Cryptosporangium japonicum]
MRTTRFAAVAAPFGRDLDECFARIGRVLALSRARGVRMVALPDACLGGYAADADDAPPVLDPDGPEVRRLAQLAGDMVVCAGYRERGVVRYNSAVCVTGDGVLGRHATGEPFGAFDTPVGRIGMMIGYDKAFPETARALAADGAEIGVCLSAWPASSGNSSPDLGRDRWTRRFDLFDRARAVENQLLWLSANQSGTFGDVRFVASAKVVDPSGDVLATTGTAAGAAIADVDVAEAVGLARQAMIGRVGTATSASGDSSDTGSVPVAAWQ